MIVRVLLSGTGVYPRIDIMSPAVRGEADVTKPLPFTANLRGVSVPYTLALTVANVVVRGTPVVPTPDTSPCKMIAPEGIFTAVVVTLVTKPLPFTVTTGINVDDP